MISLVMGDADSSENKRSSEVFRLGDWTVDPAAGTVTRGDESSRLEPKIMAVLECLVANAGDVVSKDQILGEVWPDTFVAEVTLSSCVSELRRALGDEAKEPQYIETLPKRGYRLIAAVSAKASPAPALAAPDSPSRWPVILPWALVGVALTSSVMLLWFRLSLPDEEAQRPTRVSIILAEDEPLAMARSMPLGVAQPSLAVSPDGSNVVYVAEREGVSRLYLRPLDQEEATLLEGTDGAFFPFFSPDGEWLGFFVDGALMKISMHGGAPQLLAEARNPYGATWGTDGTILFAAEEGNVLVRVPEEGGRVLETVEGYVLWPELLPGGEKIVFTTLSGGTNPASYAVATQNLSTGEREVLFQGGTCAKYAPTGHLIYARAGSLFARAFDPARGDSVGPEVPMVDGVRTEVGAGAAQFAFSSDGLLVYVSGGDASKAQLVWVDRQGEPSSLGLDPEPFGALRLSPDDRYLAIGVAGIRDQIWVYDLTRQTRIQLTTEAHNRYPSWTRDGEWVTYSSTRVAPNGIFVKPASGAGEVLELVSSGQRSFSGPWSEGDRFFAYTQVDPETGSDIWILPAAEGRQPRALLQSTFNEWAPEFSPDGRWLAYVSDESGRYEIYVQPFPEARATERHQISSDGGEEPVWSKNGDEIFYRNARRWMVVQIDTSGQLRVGPPRLLFEGEYLNIPGNSFDVSLDGQRILTLAEADPLPPRQINVIVDWFADLESR